MKHTNSSVQASSCAVTTLGCALTLFVLAVIIGFGLKVGLGL